jgi:peptidoglycan/LPS O-acetylase OafA/YrhL
MEPCRAAPVDSILAVAARPPRKFSRLEALRGGAALLVVLFHLQDVFSHRSALLPFGALFGAWDRGVDLFFLLSGFIIMTTLADEIGRAGRATFSVITLAASSCGSFARHRPISRRW